MPTYQITAPDGTKLRITAPEGASQEDVLAYAKANYKKPAKDSPDYRSPHSGMTREQRQA